MPHYVVEYRDHNRLATWSLRPKLHEKFMVKNATEAMKQVETNLKAMPTGTSFLRLYEEIRVA